MSSFAISSCNLETSWRKDLDADCTGAAGALCVDTGTPFALTGFCSRLIVGLNCKATVNKRIVKDYPVILDSCLRRHQQGLRQRRLVPWHVGRRQPFEGAALLGRLRREQLILMTSLGLASRNALSPRPWRR